MARPPKPKGADYYDEALCRWVHWLDIEDMAEIRAKNNVGEVGTSVEKDCEIKSDSLPPNYPYHTGSFAPDGSPIFDNWAQHDDCMKRAQAAGENIGYLGRGKREFVPDDPE